MGRSVFKGRELTQGEEEEAGGERQEATKLSLWDEPGHSGSYV